MWKQVLREIRERGLAKAGDRIGVAVSGGADSVALLRALHSLREELGLVLTVLHFHHAIRGQAADGDELFVAGLAKELGLECLMGRGDAPAHAEQSGQSLESAARELRYRFFESVLRSGSVEKIATAHTMDDQAETVLMRLLRGAGTRGLAGIYPAKDAGRFIRPLLGVRRSEVETYLTSLRQPWREDETNLERKHFRNRVRHDLLPVLTRDFNPNVVPVLARSAEIAQAEEEYWADETARLLPLVLLPGKPVRGGGRRVSPDDSGVAISVERIEKHPPAVQRRLLIAVLRDRGIEADSQHVDALVGLLKAGKRSELPGRWVATRGLRELRLEPGQQPTTRPANYEMALMVPGEVRLRGMNLLVRARLEAIGSRHEGYNSGHTPGELIFTDFGPLSVRNWKPGDRFWPGQSRQEKKVKEILQELKVPAEEKAQWPVVVANDTLIWVLGTRQRPTTVQHDGRTSQLVIEAEQIQHDA